MLDAAREAPTGTPANFGRVYFISASLRRYEWLKKFTLKMKDKFEFTVADIPFEDEFKICEEMSLLLPQKIDRMCYLGESGLTL